MTFGYERTCQANDIERTGWRVREALLEHLRETLKSGICYAITMDVRTFPPTESVSPYALVKVRGTIDVAVIPELRGSAIIKPEDMPTLHVAWSAVDELWRRAKRGLARIVRPWRRPKS